METSVSLRIGTTTGTLLSIAPQLLSEDFGRTLVLGAVGATSSFVVSLVLKWLFKRKK